MNKKALNEGLANGLEVPARQARPAPAPALVCFFSRGDRGGVAVYLAPLSTMVLQCISS